MAGQHYTTAVVLWFRSRNGWIHDGSRTWNIGKGLEMLYIALDIGTRSALGDDIKTNLDLNRIPSDWLCHS